MLNPLLATSMVQVPRLENFDRFGVRRDAVAFHPAYHELMELGCRRFVGFFLVEDVDDVCG